MDQIAGLMNKNVTSTSYSQSLRDNLQNKINDGFEFASDYFIIQKESSTTPNLYEDIPVRITVPYQLSQRYTIKDDCRELIFKSNDIQNSLGDRYQFNNFYWLTVDTGRVETPTNSCQIERCNATLKFYDENGDYNEIPCIAQSKSVYDVKQDKMIWISDGKMRVLAKYDSQSQKIDFDRRFLLNGMPWRVTGKDTVTYVRNGNGYEEFYFTIDTISPEDDLINGIADSLTQKATHSLQILNGSNLNQDISTPLQLNTTVTRTINNISTILSPTPLLIFNSSNDSVCTVDSNGLCTFHSVSYPNWNLDTIIDTQMVLDLDKTYELTASGEFLLNDLFGSTATPGVIVSVKLASDESVVCFVNIDVYDTPMDNYTIVLESASLPDAEIKLSVSKTYVASLYNNSVLVDGSQFDFVLDGTNVPNSAFVYTVLGDNSVSILCKQYTYDLMLTAKWRNDNSVIQTKSIKLRGLI